MFSVPDKREIHHDILEWHERQQARQNSRFIASFDIGMLGYHAMLAEEHLKAFAYFEAGIHDALAAGAMAETIEAFAYSAREIAQGPVLRRQADARRPQQLPGD